MVAAPSVNIGPYQSNVYPFLGAVAAICLSNAERKEFWEAPAPKNRLTDPIDPTAPLEFCEVRYSLRGRSFQGQSYAGLLLAPAGLPRPCKPNNAQIDTVVDALQAELKDANGKDKAPAPVPDQPVLAFDAVLEGRYPMVAKVYRYFLGGGAALPATWVADLRREFKERNDGGEQVW